MESQENTLPEPDKLAQEARKEINTAFAISPDLVLAYRRCRRECWLRFHDESALRSDEPDEPPPPMDIELDLEDGSRAVLHEILRMTSRDQLLRSVIPLCALPSGALAILVLSGTMSAEECRLRLAFDSYVLEQNGIGCSTGLIRSRRGTLCEQVEITEHDMTELIRLLNGVYELIRSAKAPVAKDASAVCDSCRIAGICLPDEGNVLLGYDEMSGEMRRSFFAPREDREPFYITTNGSRVGISGEKLVIRTEEKEISKPLGEVGSLVLMGNIQVTTQALRQLCDQEIPVLYYSSNGWFYGMTSGSRLGVRNAISLRGQILCATDPGSAAAIGGSMIKSKIHNQRVLILRNLRNLPDHDYWKDVSSRLMRLQKRVLRAREPATIMGYEGEAAAIYMDGLSRFVARQGGFVMDGRNRKPPRDPVNSMLSFGYALLERDLTAAVLAEGLSLWIGFLHSQRSSKPALVLDIMEEFRPLVVDSMVINIVSRNYLTPGDFTFEYRQGENGEQIAVRCTMVPEARKKFIRLYENKVQSLITHPEFGYKVSWRRCFTLQVKILCKVLRGELDRYQGMETR